MSKKTFEELFAELQQKAATGDPATSRTAELVQAGVHTIGKKVVEEAAEVWMAAEYIPGGPRTVFANWGTFIGRIVP